MESDIDAAFLKACNFSISTIFQIQRSPKSGENMLISLKNSFSTSRKES